jgi:hypothetical protein
VPSRTGDRTRRRRRSAEIRLGGRSPSIDVRFRHPTSDVRVGIESESEFRAETLSTHPEEQVVPRTGRAQHPEERVQCPSKRVEHRDERFEHREEQVMHHSAREEHRCVRGEDCRERGEHRDERALHRRERVAHREERAARRCACVKLREEWAALLCARVASFSVRGAMPDEFAGEPSVFVEHRSCACIASLRLRRASGRTRRRARGRPGEAVGARSPSLRLSRDARGIRTTSLRTGSDARPIRNDARREPRRAFGSAYRSPTRGQRCITRTQRFATSFP